MGEASRSLACWLLLSTQAWCLPQLGLGGNGGRPHRVDQPRGLRQPQPIACRRHCSPVLAASSSPRGESRTDDRGTMAVARGLVGSGGWRTSTASALIALDIMFYAFPLPFIPEHLARLGYSSVATSRLLSSFSLSALAAGAVLVIRESRRTIQRSATRSLTLLAILALSMAAVSAVQAFVPSYSLLFLCRCVQGAISQASWSLGLSFAASQPPLLGISSVAWVMTGNSVGEVMGPVFGGGLHAIGGLSLPFGVASLLALLLAIALGASALAEPAATPSPSTAATISSVVAEAPAAEASIASTAEASVAWRDVASLRVSVLLSLVCGMVRAALDILLPIWLRARHGFGVTSIARLSAVATICFVLGSASAGRLLPQFPNSAPSVMLIAGLAASLVTAGVLLPSSALAVSTLFCLYYGLSAFVGVAATAALEARGSQIGATDGVMATSVFLWTVGFAGGGLLSNLALGGAGSPMRQRTVLAVAGLINAIYVCVFSRSRAPASPRAVSATERDGGKDVRKMV